MLDRNADFFSDIGCCNFVEHEIEIKKGSVPHRKEARRMTPHKSEACRKKIDILMEVPVRLRRGRGKKEGGQYWFCCDFCYLNECGNDKGRIPDSPHRREPLQVRRCKILHEVGFGLCVLESAPQKTRFACKLGLNQWKRVPFGL